MAGRCPTCDGPIDGFVSTGPDRVAIDPCGHQVDDRKLADVARHVRRATVHDAGDGDLYIADGGQLMEPDEALEAWDLEADSKVLEAVAERGDRYLLFELLGRVDDLFLGVQDLRRHEDVDQVDVDHPLEDVVDELVRRVDNMVVDDDHARSIAGNRLDLGLIETAMEKWGSDDG